MHIFDLRMARFKKFGKKNRKQRGNGIALQGRNSRLIPLDSTINALKPAVQAGKPVLLKHNEDECKAFKIKIIIVYIDLFLIEAGF